MRGTVAALRTLIPLTCLLLLAPMVFADEDSQDDKRSERPGPMVGGRLAWVSSDDLDLLGDLWADVPFRLGPRSSLFVDVATRAVVEKTTQELTFLVRDLDYIVDVGWRGPMSWAGDRPISIYVGQQGKERVDADGQPYLRYLGFGIESHGYRYFEEQPFCRGADCRHRNRWAEWRFAGGPVTQEREVDGDLVIHGNARFWPGPRRSKWASMFRGDVRVNGFFDGGDFRADVTVGPSLAVPIAGGRRFAVFAHYQWSDNPLGIGTDALLFGIDYAEGAAERPVKQGAPELGGILSAGLGDGGRRYAQMELRFVTPGFARDWYAVFDIEANVLTADDTGDLFYLYFVGFERFLGNFLTGAYFYHRSNHQLAEQNDRVTSLNVLEGGIETREWWRAGPREIRHAWGTLDGRVRVGYLIDSAFGEDHRWHLRGGVRWTLPLGGRTHPFVLIKGEFGDIERETYALGVSTPKAWDFQIEYREDEQYFSEDRTALLAVARYLF
jgi:hypothetical protein